MMEEIGYITSYGEIFFLAIVRATPVVVPAILIALVLIAAWFFWSRGRRNSQCSHCICPIDAHFHDVCKSKSSYKVKKENAIRRLNRDRQNLLQEEDPLNMGVSLTLHAVSAGPIENNDLVWTAIIHGPQGSLFEDGIFKILLVFTEEYPFEPPHVRFISKMFHPNISSDGKIPILFHQEFGQKWSPGMTVKDILQLIRTLLLCDFTNSWNDILCPNQRAVQLIKDNSKKLKKNVLDCVQNSLRDLSEIQDLKEKLCPCILEHYQCSLSSCDTIYACPCL